MVVGCMFETILLKLFYNQISVLTTVSYSVITIYRGDSIIAALPLYLERMMSMTREDQELLERINEYADKVLKDFDPQKTRVSFQLEKLKPNMLIFYCCIFIRIYHGFHSNCKNSNLSWRKSRRKKERL